jgi:1-acylglycerone phosphate reductase
LSKEYAQQGVHVVATVLPSEDEKHLSVAGISCFKLDVTRDESILDLKKMVDELTGGRLDVLVNNA